MILTVRTDKPGAEVGLFDANGAQISYEKWQAHRQLSETIHKKIDELLSSQGLTLGNIKGVVFYEGPGSFTGLRIGAAVSNALAGGLDVPVVSAGGSDWTALGIKLLNDDKASAAIPLYDSEPKTTIQKK